AGLACGCKYTAVAMIALPLAVVVLLLEGRSFRSSVGACVLFSFGALVAFSPWLIKNRIMTGNPVFPLANGVFQALPTGWGEAEAARWDEGHSLSPDEATTVGRLGALWRHVPDDKYQRFGPMILLLAIVGLFGRRRDRIDLILIIILALQLVVWIFFTHLFARFAVVLLIPLALLAGRSLLNHASVTRQAAVIVVVVVGVCWNFAHAAGLLRAEWLDGADASLFYEGKVPGYEYFEFVN
ncbi:unnamed protein product, partial [marine sediment metagenome]